MNTIRIPYEIIQQYEHNGRLDSSPFSNFIFDEFKLKIEKWIDTDGNRINADMYIWFNNKGCNEFKIGAEFPLLTFSLFESEIYYGPYAYFVDSMNFSSGKIIDCSDGFDKPKTVADYAVPTVQALLTIIVFCLSYIMNYPRDRKQTRVSSHKYSREYRLSTKQNRIYLFSDILKYVSDTYVPEGQHHSIQCPCWEVRGHYRHYKSGKVVFIPAYKKGKQRDKAEPKPKEYYV